MISDYEAAADCVPGVPIDSTSLAWTSHRQNGISGNLRIARIRSTEVRPSPVRTCSRATQRTRKPIKEGIIRKTRKCESARAAEANRGRSTRRRPRRRTPQGGVVSPLSANIYWHCFEVLFHGPDGPGAGGQRKDRSLRGRLRGVRPPRGSPHHTLERNQQEGRLTWTAAVRAAIVTIEIGS